MYSPNLSDFTIPENDSHLLSDTSSRTGHGGDDLSLSELSIVPRAEHDGPMRRRPFSLLAQPAENDSALVDEDEEEGGEGGVVDQTMTQEDIENARKLAAKSREEKLQHDLYILKKLNSAFDVYKEALRATKSTTECVAEQLVHTNELLNKYMNILSKSEKVTKLMLDERWEGAEADDDELERERKEEEERRIREEEERILAEKLERERLQREEQERKEREEKERLAKEKSEASKAVSRGSGVRGVRGTRASMRGMRGTTGTSTRGTTGRGGTSIPTSGSGGISRSRPGSSASGTVRGTSRVGTNIPRKV
ncbi:DASH complex subunit Duo1-domain-containing protein [Abortiporus biennis]|nr:DASH complex subunit Duo1-domain-containing protein [Abortiporus biennis]